MFVNTQSEVWKNQILKVTVREGFVETAIFNMVMVRRRVRDVNLRFDYEGRSVQTGVF